MVAKNKISAKSPKRSGKRRRRIEPEDILKLQYIGIPKISPDGKTIIFTKRHVGEKPSEYVSNLWTVDCHTSGAKPQQFTSGDHDGSPQWAPDSSKVAFISAREKVKPQIYIIDAHGGEAVALTKFPEGSINNYKWSPDGKMLAVSFRERGCEYTEKAKKERKEKGLSDPPKVIEDDWYKLDGDGYFLSQRYHLYLVNAETGVHKKIYSKDTLGFFTFDFSPDSRQLVIATNRDRRAILKPWKYELLRLNIASGKLTAIPNLPAGPKESVIWSPDGKMLAFAGRVGEDSTYSTENLELYVCDAAKGNARSLTGREDYCLLAATLSDTAEVGFEANIKWSSDSKRIFMQIGWHGEAHVASIDLKSGSKIKFLTTGPSLNNMGNLSADGKSMALMVDSVTKPPEVAIGTIGADKLDIKVITDLNGPLLKELEVARVKSQFIKSADGNKVQVWTMMPPDYKPNSKSRKKYPTVLQIHGGPHAQYGLGFFHEFQILAAKGYVVFYSNPRGSKGYGRDHCAAIRGSWGQADWVDMQAVIEHMKSQTFVDVKHMGIMGGSYGGYMTNWAIGHTNEFAGAITDRCVSNLVSMAGSSDFFDEPDRYWEGNAWDRPEALWNASPVKFFNNLKTPTLIIHSEGDLRCNIEQAEQVYTALKIKNVPSRFVRYPASTSHGMSRGGPADMRIHRLNEILNWWNKYLLKK